MSAKKRPVAIEDLYELTLVGDANISPDGKRIAYVRRRIDRNRNDYLSTIWLWESNHDRQFTAGDNDGSPRWSPDGSALAFLAKREGAGKARIMLLRLGGGEASPLTEKEWEVSSPTWSPDSTRIAFVRGFKTDEFGKPVEDTGDESTKSDKDSKKPVPTKIAERLAFKSDGVGFTQDKRNHICVIDIEIGKVTQLTKGDCHDSWPAWSPDGKFVAFASDRAKRWDTRIESDIWEVGATGGVLRRVSPKGGAFGQPAYSPDGKCIAFVGSRVTAGEKVTGFSRLWNCARDGSNLTDVMSQSDIEPGLTGITDFKLDTPESFFWKNSGMWFVATLRGHSNVFCWDGRLKRMTDGDNEVRDFSVAGKDIAYTAADASRPAEIWLKEGKSDSRRLTRANDRFRAGVDIVRPRSISFKGSHGELVSGWIMKPREISSGRKAPLILYIHGGPQTAYSDTFFHEMQVLVALGYGVLLINPHGSSSYGEEWMSSIHGDWGNRDFEDFIRATDTAARLPWVDPKRLAVAGGSYGGYMTSWIVGHTNRFQAAVIERSLVNMLSFVGTTDVPNWWKYAWHTTIEDDPMRLWAMSPLAYLKNMTTPALIIHSEQDHRCPVEQGEQIFVGLRKRGVPARFVRFPEESHGLSRNGKPSRRVERLHEITRWFDAYLYASTKSKPTPAMKRR